MAKNIFLDFDDLLIKTRSVSVSYVNKRYGINSTESDYQDVVDGLLPEVIQRYNKNLKITFNEAYTNYAKEFLISREWNDSILPMEDAQEVVPLLSRVYKLYIVTSRQKIGLSIIEKLLGKYFPRCFTGIHCVWEWIEGKGYCESSKKDFILNTEGEKIAYVDDSPSGILKVRGIIPSFLFDPEKWHSPIEGAGVIRNWKEIRTLFL